jgi:predicted NBD/HSP70 family sugar kinase
MLGVKTAALPASLRRTNQRTVISLLFRMGSASRADLAKAAGISQPTAGKIITELLQLGVLQEADASVTAEKVNHAANELPRLGRPGQLLQLDAQRERFLAVELGVSKTCVSALPVAVKLADEWAYTFPTPKTPGAWVEGLRKLTAKITPGGFWGVLISVPGIVDESAGKVLFSPNLHWLENVNLTQLVQQAWNLPVVLVQEIRALALGQLAAQPKGEDFFLVDFGQGVGGAIVSDGKLYSQPMPLSGEFGHTPVPGNPRACGCGAIGCLETLVSEDGLLESFAAAIGFPGKRNSSPGAAERGHSAPLSWPALVRHVATRGLEPWLTATLDDTAKVIAGALNVLGIHRVVITGGLTDFPAALTDYLSAEIQKGAMWARFGEVSCQNAPRRRAAGLVAAGIDRLVLPADEQSALGRAKG